MSDEKMFTRDEVTAIVKRRLAEVKYGGMPDDVLRSMLLVLAERVDALEARLSKAK